MKKCPYCAEEIQDEAIKCRYCFSDLTVPKDEALTQKPESAVAPTETPASGPTGGSSEPTASEASAAPDASAPAATTATGPSPVPDPSSIRYTHSGYQYVLGYGADFFGIWSRSDPAMPIERFPRTDIGWRDAWLRFAGFEPNAVEVPAGAPAPATATGGVAPPSAATGAPASTSATDAGATSTTSGDATVVRYTHSGTRYLLGYGDSFFGIWDRQTPAAPVERFPRTDDGWGEAWRRYTQIESNFTEVTDR